MKKILLFSIFIFSIITSSNLKSIDWSSKTLIDLSSEITQLNDTTFVYSEIQAETSILYFINIITGKTVHVMNFSDITPSLVRQNPYTGEIYIFFSKQDQIKIYSDQDYTLLRTIESSDLIISMYDEINYINSEFNELITYYNSTAAIINLKTGKMINQVHIAAGSYYSARVLISETETGYKVISIRDSLIEIYNAKTGDKIKEIKTNIGRKFVNISSDHKDLLIPNGDNTASRINIDTGEELVYNLNDSTLIRYCLETPDGKHTVIFHKNGRFSNSEYDVFDTKTNEYLFSQRVYFHTESYFQDQMLYHKIMINNDLTRLLNCDKTITEVVFGQIYIISNLKTGEFCGTIPEGKTGWDIGINLSASGDKSYIKGTFSDYKNNYYHWSVWDVDNKTIISKFISTKFKPLFFTNDESKIVCKEFRHNGTKYAIYDISTNNIIDTLDLIHHSKNWQSGYLNNNLMLIDSNLVIRYNINSKQIIDSVIIHFPNNEEIIDHRFIRETNSLILVSKSLKFKELDIIDLSLKKGYQIDDTKFTSRYYLDISPSGEHVLLVDKLEKGDYRYSVVNIKNKNEMYSITIENKYFHLNDGKLAEFLSHHQQIVVYNNSYFKDVGEFGYIYKAFNLKTKEVCILADFEDDYKEFVISDDGKRTAFLGYSYYRFQDICENLKVGVQENSSKSFSQFSISPNPAEEYIAISFSNHSSSNGACPIVNSGEVEIYDMLGNMLLDSSTPSLLRNATPCSHPDLSGQEGNFMIDVSHLPKGVYFLKIGDCIEKFVVIK